MLQKAAERATAVGRDFRQHLTLFRGEGFATEHGALLGSVEVAYETWGELNGDGSNAVLVLHALTGDSHAAGPANHAHPTPGWWDGLIGPGRAIDTDRYFVVCPNVLGGCRGTTGPASTAPDGLPYGSRFPFITIRDQVRVERRFAEYLGISRWEAIIGGSMGGMRALEWLVKYPEAAGKGILLATAAAATAEQVALSSLQIRMIEGDPDFCGGDYLRHRRSPRHGLALARQLAQISYRSPQEFEQRFGRRVDGDPVREGSLYAVESYLHHHGTKLVSRFDANSYIRLSQAMNHHDVGRDRGGLEAALGSVRAEVTVAGISTDRLYPLHQQYEIANLLPGRPEVAVIDSPIGHDGFLVAIDQVGKVIAGALAG